MNTQLLQGRLIGGQALRRQSARKTLSTVVVHAGRPAAWCPGLEAPSHLDGSLAGDFGFDPLGLGKDPKALKWYAHSEIFHCRLAMTAVAGILIPGLLSSVGILNIPPWYDAGKVAIANSFAPYGTLLAIELFLFGWVESKRWVDFVKPGSQAEPGSFLGLEGFFKGTGDTPQAYPGGPLFDPLGFAKGSNLDELKLKEVKNGRLALLAIIGFIAQYQATGKGPVENLKDHLASPWGANFTTNGISVPSAGLIK